VAPGAIDPNYFYDRSTKIGYLLWKDEGPPATIKMRRLARNGTAFSAGASSPVVTLLQNDAPWEGWNVEGTGPLYLFVLLFGILRLYFCA
jgi:hypothetical protein